MLKPLKIFALAMIIFGSHVLSFYSPIICPVGRGISSRISSRTDIIPLFDGIDNVEKALPKVRITYCTGCKWLLRSCWMAQEILSTFEEEIGEVSLIPETDRDGTFIIELNGKVIWDRKSPLTPKFPQIADLKQLVRDEISPDKDLGHSEPNWKK